jgi:FkbM family methyltransferase
MPRSPHGKGTSLGSAAVNVRNRTHEFEVVVREEGREYWESVQSGEWEPETFRIFDSFLTPATNYLDVGAWIGPTVLYASELAKHCYAIEPDPIAFRWLKRNIEANGIENVKVYERAILDHDGIAKLGVDSTGLLGHSCTRISENFYQFGVNCCTLTSFFEENVARDDFYRPNDPLFVKMDIEGAEALALRDINFFEKYRPTLYVSLHAKWIADCAEAAATISKVRKLYKHCLDLRLTEVDFSIQQPGLVFTN